MRFTSSFDSNGFMSSLDVETFYNWILVTSYSKSSIFCFNPKVSITMEQMEYYIMIFLQYKTN